MMRFLWGVGCLNMSAECFAKATGIEPQSLFQPDQAWLWWAPAVVWLCAMTSALFGWVWND